jgi:hypothetical protein
MSQPQRIAFIMSSNGPANSEQLKYANDDAKRIAEILSQEEYGFQISEVSKDKNSRPLLILDYLSTVISNCTEQDYFIFYFSGHGDARYGQLHLILDETDFKNKNSYHNTALSIADILKRIDYCAAKNILIILDCCHGGAIGNGYKSSESKENSKIEEVINNSESYHILLASDKLEKTREVEIHLPKKTEILKGGFLTLQLYKALNNKPSEVYDESGYISIDKINTWLKKETEQFNKNNPHPKPIPTPYITNSKVKGNFFRFNQITNSLNEKNTQPTLQQLLKEAQLEIEQLKLELKDAQDARQREQMELQLLQSQLTSKDEIIAIYKEYNSQLKEQNSQLNEILYFFKKQMDKPLHFNYSPGKFNIHKKFEESLDFLNKQTDKLLNDLNAFDELNEQFEILEMRSKSLLEQKHQLDKQNITYNIHGERDIFIDNNGSVVSNNHNYAPPRNLAKAAEEIQQLLKQLEKTNPTATEKQKVDYINTETSSKKKERIVKLFKEAEQQELKETINPTIFNIVQALMRLNQDTNENEN